MKSIEELKAAFAKLDASSLLHSVKQEVINELLDALSVNLLNEKQTGRYTTAFFTIDKEYPDYVYICGDLGENDGCVIARFKDFNELLLRTNSGKWMSNQLTRDQQERLELMFNYLLNKIKYVLRVTLEKPFEEHVASLYTSELRYGNNEYLCGEINTLMKSILENASMGIDAITKRVISYPVTDAISFLKNNHGNMDNVHLTQA